MLPKVRGFLSKKFSNSLALFVVIYTLSHMILTALGIKLPIVTVYILYGLIALCVVWLALYIASIFKSVVCAYKTASWWNQDKVIKDAIELSNTRNDKGIPRSTSDYQKTTKNFHYFLQFLKYFWKNY